MTGCVCWCHGDYYQEADLCDHCRVTEMVRAQHRSRSGSATLNQAVIAQTISCLDGSCGHDEYNDCTQAFRRALGFVG